MRKVASVLSICIIAGLLIVYVPNIIAGAGKIGDTVNAMKTADLPFGKALYAAFLYGTFQLANVAVFVQHAKSFEKQGFSYVLEEEQLTEQTLLSAVDEVFNNRDKYVKAMAESGQMDSIGTIVKLIESQTK